MEVLKIGAFVLLNPLHYKREVKVDERHAFKICKQKA